MPLVILFISWAKDSPALHVMKETLGMMWIQYLFGHFQNIILYLWLVTICILL